MDPHNPPQVLVHFYRAAVQHADVWRQRLDATTNWAVVTTAALITFTFGNPDTPHFVVLVALVFDFFFLFMETRRYQMYNLWQRRIRILHRYLIAPALRSAREPHRELIEQKLTEVADDLGRTVPAISLAGAFGYRIRRNYGPLVTLVILTWLLKLYIHPTVAPSLAEYVRRAHVGLVPGSWILLGMALFFTSFVFLAIRAPSEQMRGWRELPAPIARIPGLRGSGPSLVTDLQEPHGEQTGKSEAAKRARPEENEPPGGGTDG